MFRQAYTLVISTGKICVPQMYFAVGYQVLSIHSKPKMHSSIANCCCKHRLGGGRGISFLGCVVTLPKKNVLGELETASPYLCMRPIRGLYTRSIRELQALFASYLLVGKLETNTLSIILERNLTSAHNVAMAQGMRIDQCR